MQSLPPWARWSGRADWPWSVGISEDVLIVEPDGGALTQFGVDAAALANPLLATSTACAFEGSVITLVAPPHDTVAAAAADLSLLRAELASALCGSRPLRPLGSGLHPWSESPVPRGESAPGRQTNAFAGLLGSADPVCSLRIDVAVPDPEGATRALDGLRAHLPLLLALSANSPFWHGRQSGFASTRTALRDVLRPGRLPRAFGSYGEYVAAANALITTARAPVPRDWDARLRPDRGTVEVEIADAQSRVADATALAALVQCLVRLHANKEVERPEIIVELLVENRMAAAQKGIRALMVDPTGHYTQRASDELMLTIESCAPIARELDCATALASAERLAADPGYVRQRRAGGEAGLPCVVASLSEAFTEPVLVDRSVSAGAMQLGLRGPSAS